MIVTSGDGTGAHIVILGQGGTTGIGIGYTIPMVVIIRTATTHTTIHTGHTGHTGITIGMEDSAGTSTKDKEAWRRPKHPGVEASAFAASTPERFKFERFKFERFKEDEVWLHRGIHD